jgi:valyl-tRNA synthetase
MWSFAYPLVDGPVDGISEIVISTTRPKPCWATAPWRAPSDVRYKTSSVTVRLPIAEAHPDHRR